jgi:hypothetical protein
MKWRGHYGPEHAHIYSTIEDIKRNLRSNGQCRLGCDVVQSSTSVPTFRRNVLTPFSGYEWRLISYYPINSDKDPSDYTASTEYRDQAVNILPYSGGPRFKSGRSHQSLKVDAGIVPQI